jgi:hypothetical protein
MSASARTTLERLPRCPCVVGAEWFQYFDTPKHGREDGANFKFGLVHIRNQPYAVLAAMFAAFEVPAELLGETALKAGDEIELRTSLVTHGRAYTVEWRGRFTLLKAEVAIESREDFVRDRNLRTRNSLSNSA